jgi:hypothetical protein
MGGVEPLGVKWSQSDPKQEYQTILCETEIGNEVQKWRENEPNTKHDKIIQYFPQNGQMVISLITVGFRGLLMP